ncbi:hypothetical protein BH09MYX1_BH09MYX1_40640 [soil metagenome]
MSAEIEPTVTWGMRWAREAERLKRRQTPSLPWLAEVVPVVKRMTERQRDPEVRFQRVEQAGPPVSPTRPELDEEVVVPWDIRARLRQLLGASVDSLVAHAGQRSAGVAQSHRADAVAMGPNVFFGAGKFDPSSPRGFALLAHEATHVVAAQDDHAAWRRSTNAGIADEERKAVAQERAALGHGGPPRNVAVEGSTRAAPAPQQAMTAAADRSLDDQRAAVSDTTELRRTLVDELMRQIRTDFERGG